MYQGRVKWFNNAKGYGFIVSDSFDEDLFTHYSSIMIDGYKTLKAGQPVTFETSPGKQGMHAIEIIPISDDKDQTELNHLNVNSETHSELTASA